MRKSIVVILILFIAQLGAIEVMAARCTNKPTVEEAYKNSVAVFSGEVLEINNSIIKFRVIRPYKWVSKKEIFVMATSPIFEGTKFDVGEKYLVYTELVNVDNSNTYYSLYTGSCSRTHLLSESEEDIEKIINFMESSNNGN